jgi:hypothetical protein
MCETLVDVSVDGRWPVEIDRMTEHDIHKITIHAFRPQ